MPEGELEFGDVNPLAAEIRDVLGVGPYEKVGVVTPQFDRTDGRKPARPVGTAAAFDKMKKLPHDVLIRLGVGVWDGGDGWKHYLFPVE